MSFQTRWLLSLSTGFLLAACGSSSTGNDAGNTDVTASDAPATDALDVSATDAMDGTAPTDALPSDAGSDASADATPPPVPITVPTASGSVVGRTAGTLSSFLGIPYAAPPLGDLRWRPPAAPAPWTSPRDASMRGLACPQPPSGLGGQSVPQSEDCLTLNVWSPQVADTAHLPVMFFIHGGGFTSGSGVDPLYDGANLARLGNVVVVTINYRLGQLGFLAHPSIEDPAHNNSAGNYGLMDQQFAMQWVHDNIAHFGGDAANVTIFGESAGSISVCAQMVSPLSNGLFQRAIGESGPCTFLLTQLKNDPSGAETAEDLGARFATAIGCDTAGDNAAVAACMRAKPVSDVLAAAPMGIEIQRGRASYQPDIDGYVFTEAPWASFTAGRIHPVSFLSGTNRDEGTAFALMMPLNTEQDYVNAVAGLVPGHETEVTQTLYPVANYDSVNAAYAAFITDAVFVCPARSQARLVTAAGMPQTYLYHFVKETNIGRTLGIGVFHSSELPFVFGNFVSPFRNADDPGHVLSNAMIGYWSRFAATGDPNGAGAVQWPAFTTAGDDYLELDTTVTAKQHLHQAQCDTLQGWF